MWSTPVRAAAATTTTTTNRGTAAAVVVGVVVQHRLQLLLVEHLQLLHLLEVLLLEAAEHGPAGRLPAAEAHRRYRRGILAGQVLLLLPWRWWGRPVEVLWLVGPVCAPPGGVHGYLRTRWGVGGAGVASL